MSSANKQQGQKSQKKEPVIRIKDVMGYLEEWAPKGLQESYDNSGLIVGDAGQQVSGALICLDSIEEVIDEAIRLGCNLVIAHHPIVFSGLKSITGRTYIERTIIKAIKNDVAIYAIHTNLDNVATGVNKEIADRIGLEKVSILSPKNEQLTKLVVFVPQDDAPGVREAMFKAGAGQIGDYDQCSFNTEGVGTFRAGDETNPHVGEKGQQHHEQEIRVETIVPNYRLRPVLSQMIEAHPYEEVAYDLYPLKNSLNTIGSGMIGDLPAEEDMMDFLVRVKFLFGAGTIRHTAIPEKNKVKRVAVCGGSGSFLLGAAKAGKADVFITSDYKYHQFFDADGAIVIADIGHFESEQFTIELIGQKLTEKFTTFAVHFTEVDTNPVNYL